MQDSISEQKDALDSGQGLQFEGRVDAAELERKIAALHTAMTDLDERAAACLKESTISESDIWTIVEEQAGSLRVNVDGIRRDVLLPNFMCRAVCTDCNPFVFITNIMFVICLRPIKLNTIRKGVDFPFRSAYANYQK